MSIMTRVGKNVLEALGDSDDWVRGLHCKCQLDEEKRYLCQFPEDNTIISVNSCLLYTSGEMLSDRIGNIVQEIYNAVGYEFNVNSPKQLGEALFDKLGLPARKKTKSGYSTTVSYTHLDVYKRQPDGFPHHPRGR